MASFIELIAKIKQKNNGTFKLVDAQDVECKDGKGLDEVLNEKLDKNLGAENSDKVLITDAEGNIITQNKEDFEGGGTSDYNDSENKPQINGVELKGNKSGNDVGLVNVQQGIENSGKVLGIGQDGLVIPVENAGASDNIIYKDVAKQLNPNITDSFQRAMWNLKLYGQSTQGADPSPTNPQEITAIEKFDSEINNGGYLQKGSYYDKITTLKLEKDKTYKIYVGKNSAVVNAFILNEEKQFNDSATLFVYGYSNKGLKKINNTGIVSNECMLPQNLYNGYIFTVTVDGLYLYQGINNNILNTDDAYVAYNDKAIDVDTPYQAQPFTYTPTNPMYITQDGSIADYVDVEKGVEVYNMQKYVVTGNEKFFQDYQGKLGYYGRYFNLSNSIGTATTEIFCNYLPFVPFSWSVQKIGCCQNTGYQIHLKFANETLGITDDTPVEEKRTAFANYLKQLYASENPLYVVVVVTPTEIPIDPEQLQMLRALYTYNGVTNFLCNAPVSFTYERSLQIVINNLENAIGQTNANILLNGGNN